MKRLVFSVGLFLCVLLISATEKPNNLTLKEKVENVESFSKEPIAEEKINTDNTGVLFFALFE